MDNQALTPRPPDSYEKKLIEKYAESFANQSDLMDKLAYQLLTLELAIPGLYATALKLVSGEDATMPVNNRLYACFGLWMAALGLTLIALLPRKWKVNRRILEQDPKSTTGELGIKDFFSKSARYKRNLLVAATILFFFGIVFAALALS
jgi:hypothetical protein